MSSHRQASPAEPFDFDAAYAQVAAGMNNLHLSRVAEMPRIELYLDQLIALVDMELAFMYAPSEKVVTGAMVNNYVKQRLLPPPHRKRYTRRHLASLLFICAFKRVLPIAQIAQLLALCNAANIDAELAFDEVITQFERAVSARFTASPNDAPRMPELHVALVGSDGAPVAAELAHLLETSVSLLADKVYLESLLSLEARRAQAGAAEIV